MNTLEPGTLVCLIHGDDEAMPVGAVGEVLDGPDWMNDYDVEFPGHPCPVPPGTFWCCNRAWLVVVKDPPPRVVTAIKNLEKLLCEGNI